MVSRFRNILLVVAGVVCFASCDDSKPEGSGAIVLGDSSTIVTESDPQQLKDLVTDLQPVIPPAENKDEDPNSADNKPDSSHKPLPAQATAATPAPNAAKPQPEPAAKAISSGPGLKAEFKDLTVVIPGLTVKQAGNPNLERANGAVYTLNNGIVNGATIRIIGTVTKVSQRYQSVVVLKTDEGTFPLDALSLTTKWETITGTNNMYRIAGLDSKSMKAFDADAREIKSAVQRMTQRRRINRKVAQEIQNSVRNVRNVNQKPLFVELRSVMWKIDGKDATGRFFSKQIRIDVPM